MDGYYVGLVQQQAIAGEVLVWQVHEPAQAPQSCDKAQVAGERAQRRGAHAVTGEALCPAAVDIAGERRHVKMRGECLRAGVKRAVTGGRYQGRLAHAPETLLQG